MTTEDKPRKPDTTAAATDGTYPGVSPMVPKRADVTVQIVLA